MSSIPPLNPDSLEGARRDLLEKVESTFGRVPNIFKVFAHSPAVLKFYLGQVQNLSTGVLDKKLREQIAIVCASTNKCDYCASAHTALGQLAGLSEEELKLNLDGKASDPKSDAALTFVMEIIFNHGVIDLERIREAGYTDEEISEIIAHTCMNIFTNYFNHIAKTPIDFPLVSTQN